MHFLFARKEYEQAARTWAGFVGDRATGYPQFTWVFDGSFESKPSGAEFDWKLGSLDDNVVASLDPMVARSGRQSLRIRFRGEENVDYHHTSQVVFVTPGVYTFTALMRALDVTTDEGVGFHLVATSDTQQIDQWTRTVTGTTSWTALEQRVTVPPGVSLLTIEVARRKSIKFETATSPARSGSTM